MAKKKALEKQLDELEAALQLKQEEYSVEAKYQDEKYRAAHNLSCQARDRAARVTNAINHIRVVRQDLLK